MKDTIIYNGKCYDRETIESYYFDDIALSVEDEHRDTPQQFFNRYIQLHPDFIELFGYDFDPIEQEVVIMGNYFVTTHEEFNFMAQEDAANWFSSGWTKNPKELTDEIILNEYPDWIEENCMTLEEAQDKSYNCDGITYFSLHELCEKTREELELLNSSERV